MEETLKKLHASMLIIYNRRKQIEMASKYN